MLLLEDLRGIVGLLTDPYRKQRELRESLGEQRSELLRLNKLFNLACDIALKYEVRIMEAKACYKVTDMELALIDGRRKLIKTVDVERKRTSESNMAKATKIIKKLTEEEKAKLLAELMGVSDETS